MSPVLAQTSRRGGRRGLSPRHVRGRRVESSAPHPPTISLRAQCGVRPEHIPAAYGGEDGAGGRCVGPRAGKGLFRWLPARWRRRLGLWFGTGLLPRRLSPRRTRPPRPLAQDGGKGPGEQRSGDFHQLHPEKPPRRPRGWVGRTLSHKPPGSRGGRQGGCFTELS